MFDKMFDMVLDVVSNMNQIVGLLRRFVVAQEKIAECMTCSPAFVKPAKEEDLDLTPGKDMMVEEPAAETTTEDPTDWTRDQVKAKLDELGVEYRPKAHDMTLMNLLKVKMGITNTKGPDAPPATDTPPSAIEPEKKTTAPDPDKKYSENDVKKAAMNAVQRLTEGGMSDDDAKAAIRTIFNEQGNAKKMSEIVEENRGAVVVACEQLGV